MFGWKEPFMHDDLRRRIDQAAEAFERAKRALVRSDGCAKFSLVEYQELEQVAQNDFNATLSRIEDEIEGRIASAEEKLYRMEHADPSAALTAEELEAANATRSFVSDEAFSLSRDALAERVRAVIASGDRVGAYLYSHIIRTMASDAEYGDGAEADRLRLEGLAKELETALDPQAAARVERGQAELKELRELKDYIYLRRNGVRDAIKLYPNRAHGTAS
jgi:hypothetical protein